jgi:hypothetical protein
MKRMSIGSSRAILPSPNLTHKCPITSNLSIMWPIFQLRAQPVVLSQKTGHINDYFLCGRFLDRNDGLRCEKSAT